MTSTAKVNINAGYKYDTGAWQVNGSTSLSSTNFTTVSYNIDGTCAYFGSSFSCNLGSNIYANFLYHYEKKYYYYNDVYQWYESTVTPLNLVGTNATTEYYYDSINGQSVSSVKNNNYGAYFEIKSGISTTKSYSTEKNYGAAFSVPTPVGTFSGGVATQYVTSHTITWSTTSSNIYYHYDNHTNNASYYVTY